MNAIEPTAKKLHPLVATAAVAVIVVSVLGAIVLITDKVAAHKGEDAPAAVATTDTGAAAPAPAPAQSSAPDATNSEKPIAPLSSPPHKTTHTTKPKAPEQIAEASAPPPPPPAASAPPPAMAAVPPPPPVCNNCGVVAAVRPVKTQGQGSGVGAVAGGALGGLVGNQFGHGGGKTAMTVLGVLGGALGGNQVEKEVKSNVQWYVDVRLDNGQLQSVPVPGNPGAVVGTRVRIENGQVIREAAPQG
jgi:outer membrane lipoprotein SlyB